MVRECDITELFLINAGNSDAKCYRKKKSYSRKIRNTDVCKTCPYNNCYTEPNAKSN